MAKNTVTSHIQISFKLFIVLFFIGNSLAAAQTDIERIKQRIVTKLMDSYPGDMQIESIIDTFREDGTWPGIDYADVSREGFLHRIHANNMLSLGQAYKTENSKFYKNEQVKDIIERALKNWVDNDYICDNWWYNQIGIPNILVALLLVIGDDLPPALVEKAQPMINRANIDAQGARPGGDRIKIAGIEAKNMLFLNNNKQFDLVIKVIESEIKNVEWIGMKYGYGFRHDPGGFENRTAGGRGIQYDNSFHHRQDGVNNTLSYGLSYASAFVEWAVYTADTAYSFSDEKLAGLIDYFLDGICKTAVFGKYPDAGAKNRSMSREGSLHAYNSDMAKGLLRTSSYRKDELQEIVDIRDKGIKPTTSHATFYRHSEHFSFQRPDFFTSVRMYSTRNHNMESPYNSEGLLNHYRGDGTNHVSRTGDEYFDIWPVYDYQKIPGATIVQKPEMQDPEQIKKRGSTEFVGAVTDGKYAAVAFDFESQHDTLCARKSWFFFDEEYVALGAGISYENKVAVATTLNQCLLRDDVTISKNSTPSVIEKNDKAYENIDWVYQDGIGYVFTKPTNVHIKNNEATGSWWKINKQADSPKEEVKLDVFKLWLDHGVRPADASYEYIVVPATSLEKLKQNSSKSRITIVSNTPEVQAVRNSELNIFQAVFYKANTIDISENLQLCADSPGIVMIKTKGDLVKSISVSDPNRELGKMHISISGKVNKQGENFSAIWNKKEKVSRISIDLPQGVDAGKSVTIAL
ncbi:polysaccharide lyase family 8 super-sandwich domain-containing protein [Kriegella aquimaris]|uniref:Chondroitin AC lyase n=1 Tax=Kriegella aquimaris TaxID=192904 RepID=A0A1G9N9K8_9FLAO|nr:polysaccharide lyase family 8 super-sandwich domain-containing protein [Kriegella aquimaris]SDL83186.1 chondroitin AC lyase [Kriegella aquimaris]